MKPLASDGFRDLLDQEQVKASMEPGPRPSTPGNLGLNKVAVDALFHLKSIVTVPLRPPPVSNAEPGA